MSSEEGSVSVPVQSKVNGFTPNMWRALNVLFVRDSTCVTGLLSWGLLIEFSGTAIYEWQEPIYNRYVAIRRPATSFRLSWREAERYLAAGEAGALSVDISVYGKEKLKAVPENCIFLSLCFMSRYARAGKRFPLLTLLNAAEVNVAVVAQMVARDWLSVYDSTGLVHPDDVAGLRLKDIEGGGYQVVLTRAGRAFMPSSDLLV